MVTQPSYILTIKRVEANPAFDAEVAERQRRHGSIYGEPIQSQAIESQVLIMQVTPAQFDAIRTAALRVAE